MSKLKKNTRNCDTYFYQLKNSNAKNLHQLLGRFIIMQIHGNKKTAVLPASFKTYPDEDKY